jgi:hypothetical protein
MADQQGSSGGICEKYYQIILDLGVYADSGKTK